MIYIKLDIDYYRIKLVKLCVFLYFDIYLIIIFFNSL